MTIFIIFLLHYSWELLLETMTKFNFDQTNGLKVWSLKLNFLEFLCLQVINLEILRTLIKERIGFDNGKLSWEKELVWLGSTSMGSSY